MASMYEDETRICKQCGKPFTFTARKHSKGGLGIFCGQKCSRTNTHNIDKRVNRIIAQKKEMVEAGYL